MHNPHRNTGAAFTRADGSTWAHNAVHVPTDADLARRGYKLRVEPLAPEASAPEVPAVPPVSAEWPIRMPPETYLRLHPTGLHAALARQCLEDSAPAVTEDKVAEEGEDERPHE